MESSRAVRQFTDTALARATGTSKHAGDGWAERHLQATNFGLPTEPVRPSTKRPSPDPRHETHGATYEMVTHLQQQTGDPLKPHGLPPGYEHPQPLGPDVLDLGGPRIWPVTQEITHGPKQGRREEFDAATQEAVDLAASHAVLGFYDRRYEGRRHRGGHLYEEPQDPPTRGGWQRDTNTLDRLTSI